MTALEHANPLYLVRDPRQSGVRAPADSDDSRLRWRDPGVDDGFIDGGWSPHSLDLSAAPGHAFPVGYPLTAVPEIDGGRSLAA